MAQQAAQKHHYVPKFILRKFLANKRRERVNVFQKSTEKCFQTNISNVMAERRFNEFQIDEEFYATFEESACRLEDAVLPVYERVLKRQRILGDAEERSILGLFVAFQMLRTRSFRESMGGMGQAIRAKLEEMGGKDTDLYNSLNLSENDLARDHLRFMRENIFYFSEILNEKDFVLYEAPKGRSFYLGDSPVSLHNDKSKGDLRGNLGVSVVGIQIYVPLTSRFSLAALCPSIRHDFEAQYDELLKCERRMAAMQTLSPKVLSTDETRQFEKYKDDIRFGISSAKEFLEPITTGIPRVLTSENMDFYNSLQVSAAREFIVCEEGSFDLARSCVKEWGGAGGGWTRRSSDLH